MGCKFNNRCDTNINCKYSVEIGLSIVVVEIRSAVRLSVPHMCSMRGYRMSHRESYVMNMNEVLNQSEFINRLPGSILTHLHLVVADKFLAGATQLVLLAASHLVELVEAGGLRTTAWSTCLAPAQNDE